MISKQLLDHAYRNTDGILMQDAADTIDALVAALERANVLVNLVTVRQAIDAGDKAINASGLNPWCMNEGLASGNERISPSFIDDALALARGGK